ncbi:hypothetical protein L3X38_028182 [Prunus dulcis]|uniref:Protein FAR1-RELATED SEQUENCE n=1 Tax=Prunus dulcis TaxID=3755 RepID=A0AAD4VP72_PRUDU|nr:hypothetical protein L3X38_028182 [Prunus dulcis]
MHAFFKRYCSKSNSLMDFVTRFNRALAHLRHEELVADHGDLNEKPNVKLGMPMENQMVGMYTKKYFYKFQKELLESNSYMANVTGEDENCWIYKIQKFDANSRVRTLVHDKTSNLLKCSCRLFDFEGISCKHMLAFFRVKQIMQLPKEYIIRRWTKFSRIGSEKFKVQDGADNSLILRHTSLFQLASKLIDGAAVSEEATQLVEKSFEGLIDQIKNMNLSLVGEPSGVNNCYIDNTEKQNFVDPLHVRAKGCGKRLKSWREKIKGKSRRCSLCGKVGQHNRRKCPLLNSTSTKENQVNETFVERSTTDE